jgi:hypothetical protein
MNPGYIDTDSTAKQLVKIACAYTDSNQVPLVDVLTLLI